MKHQLKLHAAESGPCNAQMDHNTNMVLIAGHTSMES